MPRHDRRRKMVRVTIITFILMLLTLPYFILHIVIPNDMKFLLGNEHSLNYFLPIKAELIVDDNEEIAFVNENPISSNENISINRPIAVTFNKIGEYKVQLKLFGIIPLKKVNIDVIEPYELIPCGKTIGVEMDTDGILILGLGSVQGSNGDFYDPAKGKLYTGDLIKEANGVLLNNKEDLIKIIELSQGDVIHLRINRYGSYRNVDIKPVKSIKDNKYKLGIWVRDDTQGIGTITYVNPKKNTYGALGHGITDVDTKELMTLKDGKITNAQIISVTKGEKGSPGEIEGVILKDENNVLGDVRLNTEEGIFGKINNTKTDLLKVTPIPIALQQDVREGAAYILSDVCGEGIVQYEVKITKVSNFNQSNSKGMIVEITDERLLSKTNGIIQGMSGSPIIQDGNIIGAVTHVFVQNPAKGYGIYIENMLKKEKLIDY